MRRRRDELNISQGDIIRALGYKSANSVSNIELGIESLPAKRAYAWADILEVARDAFFLFVTGESDGTDIAETTLAKTAAAQLTAAKTNDGKLTVMEEELLAHYRKLSPADRRKLRLYAADLSAATPVEQRKR